MNLTVQGILQELHDRMAAEQAEQQRIDRDEFGRRINEWMLPVGAEAGHFLNLLIRTAGCTRVLEAGTSVGYSTVWLAEAVSHTGGTVLTTDTNPDKHAQAQDYVARAGLASHVNFVAGDAIEVIQDAAGPFDFVLLDVWKDAYLPCLEAVLPKLAPGALVLADNIISPASESTQAYAEHVRNLAGMDSMLIPVGNGLELSRWTGA